MADKITTPTSAPADGSDLMRPYLGWLDHYRRGWQAVLVYQRDGGPVAHRLGGETPLEWAVGTCRLLAELTGLPVAGELRRQGFVPIGREAERAGS